MTESSSLRRLSALTPTQSIPRRCMDCPKGDQTGGRFRGNEDETSRSMSVREPSKRAVLPDGGEPVVALPQITQVGGGADIPFGIALDQVGVTL
jgi:hypothetical protein